MTSKSRPVEAVVTASRTLEGGGFEVFRPFPTADLDQVDPFLLLDEMAPKVHQPGEMKGAPDHPHRGFETVTFMLEGEVEHRDSAGNHGTIGPGDVQWMTAGDGIVHSEMPSKKLQTEGGPSHGLQIWVNLPRQQKRTTPKYQALPKGELANAAGQKWSATVVAGSMLGVTGPAETNTAVGYARVTVQPGGEVRIPVPDGHTALVYAFDGSGTVGDDAQPLWSHQLAVFERSSGDIVLAVPEWSDGPIDTIVLTGEPINEPVERYGPFVMNTRAELVEAFDDFNAGRMGSIAAVGTT